MAQVLVRSSYPVKGMKEIGVVTKMETPAASPQCQQTLPPKFNLPSQSLAKFLDSCLKAATYNLISPQFPHY